MTTTNANANATPLYVAKLTLGLEYDREGEPLPSTIAYSRVLQIKAKLNRFYGGCSLYFGYGSWLDDYGTVVSEQIVTFVVYDGLADADTFRNLCHAAGQCLEQHSVAMEYDGRGAVMKVDYDEYYRRLEPPDNRAASSDDDLDDALDDDDDSDDDDCCDPDLQSELPKLVQLGESGQAEAEFDDILEQTEQD